MNATVFQAVRDLVGNPISVTATGLRELKFGGKCWQRLELSVYPNSFESGCLGAITMAMKFRND